MNNEFPVPPRAIKLTPKNFPRIIARCGRTHDFWSELHNDAAVESDTYYVVVNYPAHDVYTTFTIITERFLRHYYEFDKVLIQSKFTKLHKK